MCRAGENAHHTSSPVLTAYLMMMSIIVSVLCMAASTKLSNEANKLANVPADPGAAGVQSVNERTGHERIANLDES